jgi:hypothetical protein
VIDPGAGGTFDNSGTVDIGNGAVLTFSEGLLANAGTIVADGTLSVATDGTLAQGAGAVLSGSGQVRLAGDLDITGTSFTLASTELIFEGGDITGDGTLVNQSDIAFMAGGTIGVTLQNEAQLGIAGQTRFDGDVTNTVGTIALDDGADAVIGSLFSFGGGSVVATSGAATITLDDATFALQSNFALNPDLSFNAVGTVGNALTLDTFNFTNSGVLAISADADLAVSANAGGAFVNQGTISIDGDGSITATGVSIANQGGVFDNGSGFGLVTVDGDMSFDFESAMHIDLGGTATTDHDRLAANGTLALGGTLVISEIDPFDVGDGNSFQVIDASGGSLVNSFDTVVGLEVNDDFVLDLTQSGTELSLVSKAVTNLGDGDGNTLTGTTTVEVFLANGGEDTIVGGGGADLMHGGDGDDVFVAADTSFGRLDGGADFDLVEFSGDATSFNLRTLRGDQLSNIEQIDITGNGGTLMLDVETVFSATGGTNTLTDSVHTLIIDGEGNDSVKAGSGWDNETTPGSATILGEGYSVFQDTESGAQMFVNSAVTVSFD